MATKKKAKKAAPKTVNIRLTLPQAERAYRFLNAVGIGADAPQELGGYRLMASEELTDALDYDNRIDTILFDKLHVQLGK